MLTEIQIPFIIPLGTKPDQCHDAITPNDMTTSLSCAFTGFILLYGGVAVVTWCLLRTIALHLQVCWEVVIGAKFMWLSFLCGWGLPAVIITIMGIFTGVSYRFGDVCHINGPNSTADYWIPILVITAISLVLQATTLIYCINVYVRSLFDSGAGSTSTSGMHSGLPSYSGSVRTMTARQAYKRIRRVLQLQWRSVAVVLTIIVNVIYFCVVFLELNKATALTPANLKAAMPWLACLVLSQGNANECVSEAGGVSMNEAPILAVLFLLPLAGLWNFIFVVRTSMFTGWIQFARGFFVKRVEFVSADARERVPDVRTYEMLSASRQQNKTPDPTIELARSPTPGDYKSNVRWSGTKYDDSPDTYGPEAKYSSPTFSFSSPRPPSASHTNPPRQWDVSSSFAPSMPNYSRHSPEGRR